MADWTESVRRTSRAGNLTNAELPASGEDFFESRHDPCAIAVGVTSSLWPDVIVGLAIAALFLHSAWQVSSEAWGAWRGAKPVMATGSARPSSEPANETCCKAHSSCCQ